ncbi:MAG: hypothetical protein J6X70_08995 [Muribaculaceae bacterium]|nr:hypothetical protein [Muribaculaceae bacterium]
MRKIFIPILTVLAITIVAAIGNTGCTGCSTGDDTTKVASDTIDTTLVNQAEKPITLVGIAVDGARRSVDVQPLDNPDTTYHFDYPADLDEQSRTSWVIDDTIVITYYKRGNDTETDSIVKIEKK